jgi:hypothetical protein
MGLGGFAFQRDYQGRSAGCKLVFDTKIRVMFDEQFGVELLLCRAALYHLG